MDMFDLAGTLFGNRRDQVAQGSTLTATGSTASTDGVAGIVIDADVTPAEGTGDEDVDQTVIDLPTSPDVAEGDEVIVTLVGDGPLKTPIVTANPGSGDRMAAAVQDAHDLAASVEGIAQEAKEVAQATGQNFWPDTDGVHVTQVTKDEWNDPTSPNYHSGANVLINALGQLFRDGLFNLLALVAGSAKVEQFTIEDTGSVFLCDLSAPPLDGADGLTVTSASGEITTADWTYYPEMQRVVITIAYTAAHVGDVVTIAYRTSSGMALYDGAGNATENVVAEFSGNGAIMGKASGPHITLTSDELDFYDGDERVAAFTPTLAYIGPLTISTEATGGGSTAAWLYSESIALGSLFDSRYGGLLGGFSSTTTVPEIVGTSLKLQPIVLNAGVPQYGTASTFTMANVILALTNAAKSNTWVSVSAANWATMNSGYSIVASDMKYNAYQRRIIGSLQIRETAAHSAGNNVCGTVKSGYRPPSRQIIHTTTNGDYKMFVDAGGGLTLVLGSATSANTNHWFALDYIVNG